MWPIIFFILRELRRKKLNEKNMNRLSQLSLFALSTYIGAVLFLSILLTNERFYMYILNTYIEPQSSLEIRNIHWHPINPSLKITDLRIGEEEK